MRFLINLFKKTPKKEQSAYAYMGSAGISPTLLNMYEQSVQKMKRYE